MTYSEAFPLWVAEVYRNHGYEPDKWYGSEVAETLYNEARKLKNLLANSGVWPANRKAHTIVKSSV